MSTNFPSAIHQERTLQSSAPAKAFRGETAARVGVYGSGRDAIAVAESLVAQGFDGMLSLHMDTQAVPYGAWTSDELRGRVIEQMTKFIERASLDVFVWGCNTASIVVQGLDLAGLFPGVAFVDPILPTSEVASSHRKILVVGTTLTIQSGAYEQAIWMHNQSAEVESIAIPELASLVERVAPTIQIVSYLENVFRGVDANAFDCIVFGCTHYGYAEPAFHEMFEDLPVVDSVVCVAEAAVRRVVGRAASADTLSTRHSSRVGGAFMTKASPLYQRLVSDSFGIEPEVVR